MNPKQIDIVIRARDEASAIVKETLTRFRSEAQSINQAMLADAQAQARKVAALAAEGNKPAAAWAAGKSRDLYNRAVLQGAVASGLLTMEDRNRGGTVFGGRASDAEIGLINARTSLALSSYRQRVDLEDRYYAATHTYLQNSLREHDVYYSHLRRQHAGNTQMLTLIDRTYLAERNRMLRENVGGGGGGGSVFGRRSPLAYTARFIAADMAGQFSPEAGYALSMMASMERYGMGVAAGAALIAGGFITAAGAIKEGLSGLDAMQKSARELNAEMQQFVKAVAIPKPTTPTGLRMEAGLNVLDAQIAAAEAKVEGLTSSFYTGFAGWFGGGDQPTTGHSTAELEAAKYHVAILRQQREGIGASAGREQEKQATIAAEEAKKSEEQRSSDNIARWYKGEHEIRMAEIRADFDGYEQKRRLLEEQHDWEIKEARKHGADMGQLLRGQFLEDRQAARENLKQRTQEWLTWYKSNQSAREAAEMAEANLLTDQGARMQAQFAIRAQQEMRAARDQGVDPQLVARRLMAEATKETRGLQAQETHTTAPLLESRFLRDAGTTAADPRWATALNETAKQETTILDNIAKMIQQAIAGTVVVKPAEM